MVSNKNLIEENRELRRKLRNVRALLLYYKNEYYIKNAKNKCHRCGNPCIGYLCLKCHGRRKYRQVSKWKKREQEINKGNTIPIIKSDEGSLVCIGPDKPMPKIIMVGESRMGMSYLTNATIQRYWKVYGSRVNVINDRLNEFKQK